MNEEIKQENTQVEETYHFPTYGKTVVATSLGEATATVLALIESERKAE